MSDTIDGTFVDVTPSAERMRPGTALAVGEREAPAAAPPSLFGTDDPVKVIENAVRVADALKAVVVSKKLVSNIQGKEYPQVEAWLTLAAMLRLTTICEWSRPVDNGWEARVFVRDARGETVGAAEAQCLSTERSKKTWEDYALRSMSQTRATSKALRSVLGFIMVLSGFEATPTEEMPGDTTPPPARREPAKPAQQPTQSAAEKAELVMAELYGRWLKFHDGTRLDFQAAMRAAGCANVGAVKEYVAEMERAANARPAEVPPASSPADSPMTNGQRKKIFALHNDLGHDDDARRFWYDVVCQKQSSKDLSRVDAQHIIDKLESELQKVSAA